MLELEHSQQSLLQAHSIGYLEILRPVMIWVGAGLFCYGASMLFWLAALSKYDLSFAYPILGLGYVLVYVLAVHWPYFGEEVSISRTFGTALIMAGVSMVAGSAHPGDDQVRRCSGNRTSAGA